MSDYRKISESTHNKKSKSEKVKVVNFTFYFCLCANLSRWEKDANLHHHGQSG